MNIVHIVEDVSVKNKIYSIYGFIQLNNSSNLVKHEEIKIELILQNQRFQEETYSFEVIYISREDLYFVYGSKYVNLGFEANLNLDEVRNLKFSIFDLLIRVSVDGEINTSKIKLPNYFFNKFDPSYVFNITNYRREVKRLLDKSLNQKIVEHVGNNKVKLFKNEKFTPEDFFLYRNQLRVVNNSVEIEFHSELFNGKELIVKLNNTNITSKKIENRKVLFKLPNILYLLFTRFYIRITPNQLEEINAKFLIKKTNFLIIDKFIFRYISSPMGWYLLNKKIGSERRK